MKLKSKVGDIYEVQYPSGPRYFQLVAFDETQLMSDVIAVFNNAEITDFTVKALEKVGVEFYSHTMVDHGVKQGLWNKVAETKPVNFSKALFKTDDESNGPPEKEPFEVDSWDKWLIWKVNGKWKPVKNIKKYPNAFMGIIYPPSDIVSRIEHGKYPGAAYYGEVR